jgi:hypothetical protein
MLDSLSESGEQANRLSSTPATTAVYPAESQTCAAALRNPGLFRLVRIASPNVKCSNMVGYPASPV